MHNELGGVDFGEGNLFEQMKAIIPILIPLFVSSFNRAEDLATAMEARGYQGGTGRTKYRVLNPVPYSLLSSKNN